MIRDCRYKYVKESCHFPKNITTWTNHGLWPSVNESYPNFCNNSWHLEEKDITDIEDQLRSRWASYAGQDGSDARPYSNSNNII